MWAPKYRSISSVWSRLASDLDHGGLARRGEAGEQHCRLDLGRRDRGPVDDRQRVARARKRDRQPPALRRHRRSGSHQRQRIEDATHRPGAQRGVAVEGRGDRAARHGAHDQPATGAGIAEIEGASGAAKPATPTPSTLPGARTGPFDPRAHGSHGLAGVEHVLAFEQAADAGAPTASAPRIRARCEIDLSPGTRTRPSSGAPRRAVSGEGDEVDIRVDSDPAPLLARAELAVMPRCRRR